jgi:FkbM family methyltransferase
MKAVNGIWLPDSDAHFGPAIEKAPMYAGKGSYQLNKIEAALRRTRSFRTALDVGGHVGLWSRVLADRFERVLAFEPIPELANCFRRNLADKPNVTLFELALGNVSSACTMVKADKNTGNAHVAPTPKKSKTDIIINSARANMIKLDSLRIDSIDFIKIDVEGFELFVIEGGERIIRENRPVMVIEQKPDNAERYKVGRWDATALLRKWGAKEAEVISGDHIVVWPK